MSSSTTDASEQRAGTVDSSNGEAVDDESLLLASWAAVLTVLQRCDRLRRPDDVAVVFPPPLVLTNFSDRVSRRSRCSSVAAEAPKTVRDARSSLRAPLTTLLLLLLLLFLMLLCWLLLPLPALPPTPRLNSAEQLRRSGRVKVRWFDVVADFDSLAGRLGENKALGEVLAGLDDNPVRCPLLGPICVALELLTTAVSPPFMVCCSTYGDKCLRCDTLPMEGGRECGEWLVCKHARVGFSRAAVVAGEGDSVEDGSVLLEGGAWDGTELGCPFRLEPAVSEEDPDSRTESLASSLSRANITILQDI